MSRHGALAAVVALFLILAQVATAAAAPANQSPGQRAAPAAIDKALQADLKAGTATKILVEFDAKANLGAAKKIKERTKRGNAVLKALTDTAAASQKTAKATVAKTKGAKATSYWLTNVLVVEADAKTLDKIAKQLVKVKGVTNIRAPKIYPLVKPVETKIAILAAASDPEWGVEKIRADQAWADGVLGQGIVVSNVDTGVDYLHPALVEQYRGNDGDGSFTHDYNWWDPSGICGPEPCDNAAHGTHTMGTMVGGDGPGPFTPDTGVAPGAKWIAAKGCEDFGCSETSLLSSGQFILAPTDLNGQNPDPSKRPDIVNNSWGSGPGDTFYLETVQAWRAAGIIPVFSSGNPGPSCGEGGSPGDFLESFSVGATDVGDLIADFSGRGPSTYGKVNPDVAAPGVDVISTVPGGGYESFSGTSMAAPHVAGTLALMMSAESALRGDYDAATTALRATAVDRLDDSCGGDPDGDPNNVYGDGRIDAKAAVDLVATGGTLAGTVTDIGNAVAAPIAGARVTANDGTRDFTAVTDTNGDYDLFLAAGTYLVTAEAFGYYAAFESGVAIVTDETTDQDFGLTLLPRFTVSGTITASEDGSPIANATVKALGTPVPAAETNASGDYSLELPIGTYTLRATANGCTESGDAEVASSTEDEVVDQDFSLFRKLDDFGHACSAIPFDWVDATGQSALYGDEFAGRLRLPFAFPFYGGSYEQVFLSDNGYLNFLAADQYNSFPQSIPSTNRPNAAIYALWQDLYLDAGSSIDYELIGTAPDRAFVIAYENVKAFGAGGTISFQVKLWENGNIDLLYGPNGTNPGDGRNATIGIEDATGTDALQLGFMEPVLSPNSAIRITTVPTGIVSGIVTDANDGTPIVGATVTAQPGGREATTDETGAYTLRLLPGSYTLTASKEPWESASSPAVIVDGSEITRDFALNAAIGSVDPTAITETIQYGDTTTVPITISNSGTADLTWEARERQLGVTIPELPPAVSVTRNYTWGPLKDTAGVPRVIINDTVPSPVLSPIISDPAGDSAGSVDAITVRAGSDGQVLAGMAIDFSAATPIDQAVGYVFLDTDQDPTTGLPAEAIAGLPTQDVGMEYFVDLFGIHDSDPVIYIVNVETFDAVAVPAWIDGQSVYFDMPLDALGGDDGNINTAMVLGDFSRPMDWAPDEGHGTIEPFSDLPWVVTDPESGTVPAGGSQVAQVTLGADLAPGDYQALLVLVTNDPGNQQLPITIDLTVEMPEEFGAIKGTVSDAHSGEPLPGVTVSVAAEWPAGTPLVLTATTGSDGTYGLVGPEGTWQATFSLDNHLTVNDDVTIVRGVTTGGKDAALHRIQSHAVLEGEAPGFILTPDRTGSVTLQLGNPGGHADLEVEIGEVDLGGPSSGAAVAGSTTRVTVPAGVDRNARTTRGFGAAAKGLAVPPSIKAEGDVLASWNAGMTLPWGVAYDGGVWLSDPQDVIDVHFSTDGARGTEFGVGPLGDWGGDMAFDTARNLIWQVAVGGDNGIYGLDPADGSVEDVITGSPWDSVSQRGLAYDPAADVFYIGGWTEGIVYKVAGPSWETPGETLNQCSPPDSTISGLAWNRSFGMLWQATNSESDSIFLLDPITCEASVALPHPDGGGFGGAGLEIDVVGNLWTVGQNSGNAYLIESGLPTFTDVPWMTVTPGEAVVAPDGSIDVEITVDSTGLEPGVYRALVVILTNDPNNSTLQVPVTLVVPTFQQGVDSGGGATTAANGDVYAADRGYGSGPYGYLGTSSNRSTSAAIGGTADDGLYQDARIGMTSYRFAVPDGTYKVDLRFAEITNAKTNGRRFDVSIEGNVVLPGLDVFAAAGGKNIALDRTFIVSVTDGQLDIGFVPQRGDKPIINAILVTGLPEGAPGT